MFVIGLGMTIFGVRILLQKGFVERLREGMWKDDSDLFPERSGFYFEKYGRGGYILATGIIALIIGILGIITPYNFG